MWSELASLPYASQQRILAYLNAVSKSLRRGHLCQNSTPHALSPPPPLLSSTHALVGAGASAVHR
jgi:hypothetical protein